MSELALVVYDYETTGPDPLHDLPVQTAAVMAVNDGKFLPIVHSLSNPGKKIAPEATEVHGISQRDVQGYPHPSMTVSMMATYVDSLEEHDFTVIIAGQNHIRFDNTISENLGWEAINQYPQIDTFRLARRVHPDAVNHKLSTIYEIAFGEELTGAHDAMADVLGVARLIGYFCEKLSMTRLELAEYCATPQVMEILPFSQKHKGKKFGKVGEGFMRFMMTKTEIANEDIDFLESIRKYYPHLYEAHTHKDA